MKMFAFKSMETKQTAQDAKTKICESAPEPINIIRQFPEMPGQWKEKRKAMISKDDKKGAEKRAQTVRERKDAAECKRQQEVMGRDIPDTVIKPNRNRSFVTVKQPTLLKLISRSFYRTFSLKPYAKRMAKKFMKLKIVGQENLKDLHNGVIVMNNCDSRGAFAVMRALKNKPFKLAYTDEHLPTAECNRLGKAGMLLPINGTQTSAEFDKRVEYCASRDIFLLFYPEKSLEFRCEKPRTFSSEAFECACKHNLPVLPMFMVFQPTGNKDSDGTEIKYVTLFVMPAVYPNQKAENSAEELRQEVFNLFTHKYEQYYGKQF